jgi:hypothetical protein
MKTALQEMSAGNDVSRFADTFKLALNDDVGPVDYILKDGKLERQG